VGRRTCPDTLPGLTGLDENTSPVTGWHFPVQLIGKLFFSTKKMCNLSDNERKTGKVKKLYPNMF